MPPPGGRRGWVTQGGVRVIGELYEYALAGWARPEVEHTDGSRRPLPVDGWLHESPGDRSILERCQGPTLDIGSGPGSVSAFTRLFSSTTRAIGV